MTNPPSASNADAHPQHFSKSKSRPKPKLPGHHRAVTQGMSLLRNVRAFLTPNASGASSQVDLAARGNSAGFSKAKTESDLFTPTDPQTDGDACLHDCSTCTVEYPRKFAIDESDHLYGHVKGFSSHLIVATGKKDWVRDVMDEKGSVMEAVGRVGVDRANGKLMLSACDLPLCKDGDDHDDDDNDGDEIAAGEVRSDCLLLPAWKVVERVRPSQVDRLMREVVESSVTNEMPLGGVKSLNQNHNENGTVGTSNNEVNGHTHLPELDELQIGGGRGSTEDTTVMTTSIKDEPSSEQNPTHTLHPPSTSLPTPPPNPASLPVPSTSTSKPISLSPTFRTRPIHHKALILMCSHKTRDARCGQSAPLLRKEFERILRPLGLYRDVHDERPDGVGIYFINHVGGHKYSANVMIYRRGDVGEEEKKEEEEAVEGGPQSGEATQLIWLARVRPEDCENIVRFTVLQGKVVKPTSQLRGGFDRQRGLASW